jgi:hypothetical protein
MKHQVPATTTTTTTISLSAAAAGKESLSPRGRQAGRSLKPYSNTTQQ